MAVMSRRLPGNALSRFGHWGGDPSQHGVWDTVSNCQTPLIYLDVEWPTVCTSCATKERGMTRRGAVGGSGILIALACVMGVPDLAMAEPDKKALREAKAHSKLGTEHFNAGRYPDAIAEYETAYELGKRPSMMFNIARSYHLAGDHPQALEYYRKYIELDPDGEAATEANEYITTLSAREEKKKVSLAVKPKRTDEQAAEPKIDLTSKPAADKQEGVSWGWLAVGTGAVASGIAIDLALSSSSNHRFDAMDVVPVGCYALGLLGIGVGVF
jgi:tetratricopeptide (TPR) repeat protein